MIPFAPWRPDTPDVGVDGTVALGVVPLTVNEGGVAYGPWADFAEATDALAATVQGAGSFLGAEGETHIFAATSGGLFKASTNTFEDVSPAAGFTPSTEAVIGFAQLRTATEDYIIAFGDADEDLLYFDLNASTDFAQLSSAAPRAKAGAVVDGNIFMVGNTWDSTDGYVPNRVWWHSRNSLTGAPLPTTWPTIGSSQAQEEQSDYRDLDTNGPIIAMTGPVGGAVGGLVFARNSIHRIVRAGVPAVYDFYPITRDLGCPSPSGVINIRERVFFPTEDGFYATDGQSVVNIGAQKFDRWFFDNVDTGNMRKICGASVPGQKLAIWGFPSSGSNGVITHIIAYNYEIGEASLIESDGEYDFIFRSYTKGYTLEELDAFGDLDSLAFSLDSQFWLGGRVLVGGFNGSHKYGAFEGSNLAARIETGELRQRGNRRYRSTGILPVIEADSALSSGDVTASVGYRDVPNGTVTYDTATNIAANGVCPQLRSAKFQRARVSIGAGVSWKKAVGAEYEFHLEGKF
jgi:hypothetical protein